MMPIIETKFRMGEQVKTITNSITQHTGVIVEITYITDHVEYVVSDCLGARGGISGLLEEDLVSLEEG